VHAEYLVKMANDIGKFFHSEAGPEVAPAEIARHIRRFWDPRMRGQIIAHLEQGGTGLSPEVRRAIEILGTPATPANARP
jgi:formate dehydrogenase subunit delta